MAIPVRRNAAPAAATAAAAAPAPAKTATPAAKATAPKRARAAEPAPAPVQEENPFPPEGAEEEAAPVPATAPAARPAARPAPAAPAPVPAAAPAARPAAPPVHPAHAQAIAKRSQETAIAQRPVIDLAADAEAYVDEFDRADLVMPTLLILQKNSPAAEEDGPKYIPGAKAGMFLNTSTGEIFPGLSGGIYVIPCYYNRTFIEWKLREVGGGFVADHGLDGGAALLPTCRRDEKNRDILPNGNQLVQTAQYYVLLATEDGWKPVILSLTSTQFKKAREWNTHMNNIKVEGASGRRVSAPMFFNAYNITTVYESNEKGSWYGVVINPYCATLELADGEDVYLMAREFREMVAQGNVTANHIAEGEAAETQVF